MQIHVALFAIILLMCCFCESTASTTTESKLRKPSSSKKPNRRRPTTRPTKFPSLSKKTSLPSISPTVFLDSKVTEYDDEEITTERPVGTQFPSRTPTFSFGKAQCELIDNSQDCAARSNECEWYVMNPCNYFVTPVTCAKYEYGCQEKRSFCEFNRGTVLERQLQCNNKGFPCEWNRQSKQCFHTTKAPTIPPVPRLQCYDLCLPWLKNGKCDDGRPGADSSFCLLGTDCEDCGPIMM